MCVWHVDGSFRSIAVGRFVVNLPHPHPVAGGLGPVTARGHVTPATSPVLGSVEEHSRAAPVGASTDPGQLADDQRIGGTLDDWNHQPRERVTNGNEATSEATVAFRLETPGAGAPSQDSIDLGQSISACLFGGVASFGERTERRAHASRIDESRRSAGRLLHGAPSQPGSALGVDDIGRFEPLNERLELAQGIVPHTATQIVRVDEVEPESLADENESRDVASWKRRRTRVGKRGLGAVFKHWRQSLPPCMKPGKRAIEVDLAST